VAGVTPLPAVEVTVGQHIQISVTGGQPLAVTTGSAAVTVNVDDLLAHSTRQGVVTVHDFQCANGERECSLMTVLVR
jgi:hypothetical protein